MEVGDVRFVPGVVLRYWFKHFSLFIMIWWAVWDRRAASLQAFIWWDKQMRCGRFSSSFLELHLSCKRFRVFSFCDLHILYFWSIYWLSHQIIEASCSVGWQVFVSYNFRWTKFLLTFWFLQPPIIEVKLIDFLLQILLSYIAVISILLNYFVFLQKLF